MKALVSLVIAAVLIGGVYLATTSGCGARAEVAKDKVIEKIDKLLGKLDVQQKEVQMQFDELTTDTRKLKDDRIRAQVKLEQINKEKTQLVERLAKIDSGLKKLQPMLKAAQENGEYKEGDKTFTVEQLKAIADGTLGERKTIQSKLDGRIKTLVAAYAKNFDFLTKQATAADEQLKKLGDRIEEIKAKKSAIDAVKEASLLAGPSQSITDKFDKLNSDVDALFTEVESTMRIEEAKLDEQLAEMDSSSVSIDELLKDDTDVSGTLSEIDKILGDGSSDK